MVSALRTSSGYEERIQFSEMEVIDRGANEGGLLVNKPEGSWVNGWDVNVAGVRVLEGKRRLMGKERHAVCQIIYPSLLPLTPLSHVAN